MRENQRREAMIDFHQMMARVIYLTATLERTLNSGNNYQATSSSRQQDIRNLLNEISIFVGKGHGKFRD